MSKKYKYNFVNNIQTNKERRFKYKIVRLLGYSSYTARIFRDYRMNVLERLFNCLNK